MKLAQPQQRGHKHRPRTGTAIVEVAICFPVFMLILMGIIEFGRAMSVSQMLNSASRIGCRAAILDGSSNSSVTSVVKQHVASTLGCQPASVTVAISVTSGRTGDAIPDVSTATTGDLVELDVFVPLADVSWSVKNWLGTSKIHGECAMQHE